MGKNVQGPEWSFIRFQKSGLGSEIPIVFLDSPKTDRGLCVLLVLMCYCLMFE